MLLTFRSGDCHSLIPDDKWREDSLSGDDPSRLQTKPCLTHALQGRSSSHCVEFLIRLSELVIEPCRNIIEWP